jgi:hypothetical protein
VTDGQAMWIAVGGAWTLCLLGFLVFALLAPEWQEAKRRRHRRHCPQCRAARRTRGTIRAMERQLR